ncbi:uncharacterized protein LOC116657188 [Camelus ferus]|uniref:Uncharacterized protein LOC116657188 n=1 Tax=Camelus ferus TaxID=419612 RepID=A0A8B8R9J1_CAMFR|nr:uncharacterized protein LOC116657188 [Camelus ferus]
MGFRRAEAVSGELSAHAHPLTRHLACRRCWIKTQSTGGRAPACPACPACPLSSSSDPRPWLRKANRGGGTWHRDKPRAVLHSPVYTLGPELPPSTTENTCQVETTTRPCRLPHPPEALCLHNRDFVLRITPEPSPPDAPSHWRAHRQLLRPTFQPDDLGEIVRAADTQSEVQKHLRAQRVEGRPSQDGEGLLGRPLSSSAGVSQVAFKQEGLRSS